MKQFSKDLGNVSLAPKGKWSREQEYERLALVYNTCDNLSYVAKLDVPIGVEIDNREYWQPMNATGYADNNFINLTAENENGTITAFESLEEAVATILPINRRAGATLSFYNLNYDRLDRQAEFELWQFNSTDLANWENRDYWNNIYYNWNVFAGWYVGADGLKNHVKIPNVGQYAYVGSNLNDAVLYQCRTNGTWTNTGTKVRNYISVVVSGNITIGENGNWFNNSEDTGIPATPTVDEQLDNIIMQLQQHSTEINSLKASDTNLQNQITSNDTDIATLNTKHESLSRTVQGIAATGGASTAINVTYDNDSSGLNSENAQDAIDEVSSMVIYDVSACNKGTVFESLQALLSSSSLSTLIPTSVRHGGMSIRFIQGSVPSSDNKYLQFRYMSSSTAVADFTNVSNWQGVDEEPVAESKNLVESGGIYPIIEDIRSKIDAPRTEEFSGSSQIRKYFYPGIKYKIKNNNENKDLAVNFNYEDGTTGSTFYINAGITRVITTSKTVKSLTLWIADDVYNVSITTTNENQLYEKIETLKDKDIEIDDRTGVYAKYSRSVTSGIVGDWTVFENFRSGTYIVTNAIGSFTSLIFYDAENNEIYRNNNFPRGVNTEITLSSDAVKMNGYGNNLKVDIQVVAKGTILNRVDVLEAQMNTLDNKPVHDSTKRMNSGGIFKAVTVLNGYRFFEDTDVIPKKYIDYNTGDIVTRSDRFRIAKFYVEDVCNVRVAKKLGIVSDLILFKYTSSDYSTTGAERITDLQQVDCIITLEQGYYCIGWYTSSPTTDIVPNEVVVYNYKNVGKTTNIKNNNDLVTGRAAYDLYNKTLGDVITYSVEKESAITSWAFNKEISAGEYEVELLTNTSAGSSLLFYNASGTEILYIAGINGNRKIVINEPAARVGGYSSSTGLTLKITPTFALLKRVEVLEDKVGEGILFYNPQEVYEPLVSNIKYGRNAQNNEKSQFVSLLHFSDIHGKTANVTRLVEFANKYSGYINDIICTGDIVSDVFSNNDILNTYPKMLQVIGNHDAWVRSYDAEIVERVAVEGQIWVVKQKNCYDKFIAPNVDEWGVNQPSDAAEIGKCYYYKDYTIGTNKLRLIVLDCMHYNIGADLDDDVSIQNTWLTSVLTDARTNNIPVVLSVHYFPAWISFTNGAIECSYTTKYYLSSDYMPVLLVNTVEDFITNGGEFVCYITGHSHFDVIATVPNHPNQMFIAVDCATDADSVGNSVVTGKGQDCFNIISFDTISKLVKVVRVGRDTTTENTIKRRLVYRYAQFVDGYGTHNVGLVLSE